MADVRWEGRAGLKSVECRALRQPRGMVQMISSKVWTCVGQVVEEVVEVVVMVGRVAEDVVICVAEVERWIVA